jgi:hypothetical protein
MRLGGILVALYLVLAAFLGLSYSWGWAAVVVFMGLIPFVGVWYAGRQVDDSHLDWDQQERERYRR